jgi:transposase
VTRTVLRLIYSTMLLRPEYLSQNLDRPLPTKDGGTLRTIGEACNHVCKAVRQGHKNDFRDAHAVAEAVQRPTTRFVPAKTDEQLDLQALHRVRSRLVSERTAVINQIRGFLLERGIVVRQGLRFLRQQLPDILAKRTDVLSPRMARIVADLASDWRRLDERIETVTNEIGTLAKSDDSCRRVMTVPGIGRSSRARWLRRSAMVRHS